VDAASTSKATAPAAVLGGVGGPMDAHAADLAQRVQPRGAVSRFLVARGHVAHAPAR